MVYKRSRCYGRRYRRPRLGRYFRTVAARPASRRVSSLRPEFKVNTLVSPTTTLTTGCYAGGNGLNMLIGPNISLGSQAYNRIGNKLLLKRWEGVLNFDWKEHDMGGMTTTTQVLQSGSPVNVRLIFGLIRDTGSLTWTPLELRDNLLMMADNEGGTVSDGYSMRAPRQIPTMSNYDVLLDTIIQLKPGVVIPAVPGWILSGSPGWTGSERYFKFRFNLNHTQTYTSGTQVNPPGGLIQKNMPFLLVINDNVDLSGSSWPFVQMSMTQRIRYYDV